MILIRKLLWVDCSAALFAGVAVLSLSGWLSELHALPQGFIIGIGLVNLVYGTFSFSLAMRAIRPKTMIVLLVIANAIWAAFCVLATILLMDTASFFGLAHLLGEGIFVGGLAVLEWNQREQLAMAV